jgi:hypothetical protein
MGQILLLSVLNLASGAGECVLTEQGDKLACFAANFNWTFEGCHLMLNIIWILDSHEDMGSMDCKPPKLLCVTKHKSLLDNFSTYIGIRRTAFKPTRQWYHKEAFELDWVLFGATDNVASFCIAI